MNIGIDARLLGGRITGIGRYLLNILKYIPEFDKFNKYFLYVYEGTEFKNDFFNYSVIKRSSLPRQITEHYWLNFKLPQLIEQQKIDLFFTPYVLVPVKKGNYKNITVIHDAISKSCANSYSFHYRTYMNFFIPLCIKRSEMVLTVSGSSRQEIINQYNASPDKVDYVHLWTDEKYKPRNLTGEQRTALQKKYGIPEKFILYVGVLEDRKNIKGIIKISDILSSKNYNIKFVLVGKPGFSFPEIKIELQKRKEKFIHINFVEEGDLPLLYNMAEIFLFPSHYEGFGLPPLEAMKSGTPVLTSNNTSLPEVVGEGGIMKNSNDHIGFAESIIELLKNKDCHNEMRSKALLQAEKFTADKHMPRLISIFNEVGNS
jgi:glycosyltransferase involved in cell wall biosynthesis